MNRIINTRGMERAQWLEARRAGIGGSDAAAIMGASPWATPLSVWADKRGIASEQPETVAMRFGREAEDIVARFFADETGKRVARCNAILQHPEHPFMLANIDRQIRGERAGLECKTTSAFNRTDFEGGDIPPYYYWQCVHYLAVTGFDCWYLAVLVGNSAFYHFAIPRNDAHIRQLIDAETAFWRGHVLTGEPPAPTGAAADDAAIEAMHAPSEGVVMLDGLEDVFSELAAIKAAARHSERRKAELEQSIKIALGEATEGVSGRFRAIYRTQARRTVDSKRLSREQPAIYDLYTTESSARPLRITEVEA